jgi:RND family efflux transporter MFP subunit
VPDKNKKARALCFLLPLVAMLTACEEPRGVDKVEFRIPVTVAEVGLATFEDRVITTGTLRAPKIVALTVLTRGLLQVLDEDKGGQLAEGDYIKRGQRIALITGEGTRIAAHLPVARQRLETARNNLEASRALFARGIVTKTEMGRLSDVYEEAKLEYERGLHTADQNIIATPIDGVIVYLARDDNGQPLANGQMVEPGDVVAKVAPMDELVAGVDVVGEDISKLQVGLEARVRYHAWKDKCFTGRLLRFAPTIDERSRALRVEVEIDNAEGLLRPGMFVEVALISEVRANVPRVPRSALAYRGGKTAVFVLDGQRVRQQEVTTGLGDDDWVEIRQGVGGGERIVVLGLETLVDRSPVRITEDQ